MLPNDSSQSWNNKKIWTIWWRYRKFINSRSSHQICRSYWHVQNSQPQEAQVSKNVETPDAEPVIISRKGTKTLKTRQELRANTSMDCKSADIIYCATCSTCRENYIGLSNKLNATVRVHKQQVKDQSVRNIPCCEHFANCGRGNFEIVLFQYVEWQWWLEKS